MTIIYSLTIFTSAFLLFLIQPMITKMILPLLGGSPSVWNTTMVFFQAVLLAGYAYAHISHKLLGVKKQAILHIIASCLALLLLPVYVSNNVSPQIVHYPISWLVTTLAVTVGIPFFALSANAPMLQYWLANTTHKSASNPYFLYSASNLGSMIALLGFPFIMEPIFPNTTLSKLWTYTFMALVTGLIICSTAMFRNYAKHIEIRAADKSEIITVKRRIYWITLAFIPSSLLLGATTHITTDIASVPLLWVLPLAIYLLTFILAFAKDKPVMYERSSEALFLLIITITIFIFISTWSGKNTLTATSIPVIHFFILFAVGLLCHGKLALDKPSAAKLTEFYIYLSIGGVLGGIFNVLIAPVIFDRVWEYPLVLAAAALFRIIPERKKKPIQGSLVLKMIIPVLLCAAIFAYIKFVNWSFITNPAFFDSINKQLEGFILARKLGINFFYLLISLSFIILILFMVIFEYRPIGFAIITFFVFYVDITSPFRNRSELVLIERNFFGIIRVIDDKVSAVRYMMHGTTNHGIQALPPNEPLIPYAYYHKTGPAGQLFANLPDNLKNSEVAIAGLGAGGMSCLATTASNVTYYEIDPAVFEIANDPNYFTFLRNCRENVKVVLGDARLSIANEPDKKFGIIVLDVFSSDSIPVHLITKEALELYLAKLRDDGMILAHISNKYLDLRPVIRALAKNSRLYTMHKFDTNAKNVKFKLVSEWVALTKNPENFGKLVQNDEGWKELSKDGKELLWTDDYSNIFSVFKGF